MDTGNIDVTISEELIPYLCALKEGKNIRDKLIVKRPAKREKFLCQKS